MTFNKNQEEIKETNAGFSASSEEIVEIDGGDDTSSPVPGMNGNAHFDNHEGERRSRTVIHVENANKIYGAGPNANQVLSDFNMAVQEHTIYGLLGSSGCGKTTILSCIVALRSLNSGSILICGEPTGTPASGIPGKKVGYMPQEIALNLECTIQEVLTYFGRIYGMTKGQIDKRHDYLITLLSLQGLKQPIEDLSDGQKRRVSMAVALLHEPDILILDEPTVGCDPLLRESIWKFLHELVFKKTSTVIVTTHYIEEMREADRVGIMRNGRLLVQDRPNHLLQIYNESLLDHVVLKLCRADQNQGSSHKLRDSDQSNDHHHDKHHGHPGQLGRSQTVPEFAIRSPSETSLPRARTETIHMTTFDDTRTSSPALNASSQKNLRRASNPTLIDNIKLQWKTENNTKQSQATTSPINRLYGLMVKNLLVTWRNLWFTIVLILLPALTVGVFCIAVGGNPSDLRIGLINYETKDCLQNNENSSLKITCDQPQDISCKYLNLIDSSIITFVQLDSIEEAIEQIRARKLWGYVTFSDDFSICFYKRFVEGDINSNETLIGSEIKLQLDMSGVSIGLVIKKVFIDGFRSLTTELLEACEIDSTGRDLPVSFGEPIFGSDDGIITEYMGPGIGMGFIFFMCALQCGLSYIIEKKDGMLNRTMVAGVSTIEIMLSHFIIQLVVVASIQIAIALVIVYIAFAPLHGSLLLAIFIVLLNSIAGMSLGFLLATFCDDEKYAMLMAMGMVFPNFLLAGLIWPIEALPIILQYFSLILPCTLAGEALRSISLRGFNLTHYVVWSGFAMTLAWICIYWIVIIIWHKIAQRKK